MDDKHIKFSNYLPMHLWNLKELGSDRIINRPIVKSKRCGTIIFPEKLSKPCSKLIKKW